MADELLSVARLVERSGPSVELSFTVNLQIFDSVIACFCV